MPFLFANNVSTTLNGAILAAETTITVPSGAVFPTPVSGFTLRATLVRASDGAVELIDITDISTNDLTVVRAREGTSALDFADGDVIEMRITDAMLSVFSQVDKSNVYTKGQASGGAALSSTSNSIAFDMDGPNDRNLTMTENSTLAAPSNVLARQSGVIEIDNSGAYTLAYNTFYEFENGTVPTLATGTSLLVYRTNNAGTAVICNLIGPAS